MTRKALLAVGVAVALSAGVTACSSAGDAAGQAGGAASDAGNKAAGAGQDAAGQAGNAAKQSAGAAAGQIQGIVAAHPITFASQSADLTEQDTQSLRQLAGVLKTTGSTLTIATHAGLPDAAQALQLSKQRADNIAKALQEAGVDGSKIKSQANGNAVGQGDEALQTQITAP